MRGFKGSRARLQVLQKCWKLPNKSKPETAPYRRFDFKSRRRWSETLPHKVGRVGLTLNDQPSKKRNVFLTKRL